MKNRLIIIIWLFLVSCKSPDNKPQVEMCLSEIYINHYEDDSLNKNRGYVIPRMYYVFEYNNFTSDSVFIDLNTHFEDGSPTIPYLYVLFNYKNKTDTLVITDYESVNPILLEPNTFSRFTVGVPISEEIENGLNGSETVANFMKYIADNSEVVYRSSSPEDERVLKSQSIKKSKDFRVLFRDPDDTTVE